MITSSYIDLIDYFTSTGYLLDVCNMLNTICILDGSSVPVFLGPKVLPKISHHRTIVMWIYDKIKMTKPSPSADSRHFTRCKTLAPMHKLTLNIALVSHHSSACHSVINEVREHFDASPALHGIQYKSWHTPKPVENWVRHACIRPNQFLAPLHEERIWRRRRHPNAIRYRP